MAVSASLIEQLRAVVKEGSKVLTPSDEGYATSITRWSDYGERPAGVVVLAQSTEDIASTLRFAAQHSLDLAVRGGGHSTSGASSTSGGVLLDLSRLRGVTVDPVKKTVTVQGGALWSDVDAAAAEHGLATVGGTVNHTGVGGLTLGGGYGWLSSRHGLACDNLLSAKVVLADGRVVTTSPTEETDLFWAIRGAGQQFCVAVEFVFRAHDVRDTAFSGMLVFKTDVLEEVVRFSNTVVSSDSSMGYAFSAPDNVPVIIAVIVHLGSESAAKKVFGPLFALNPMMDTTSSMPYKELNTVINSVSLHGGRKSMKGSFFRLPLEIAYVKKVYDAFVAFITDVPNVGGSIILFEYVDSSKIMSVPLADTAFANRGDYMNLMILTRWEDPKYDLVCREFAQSIAAMSVAEAAKTRSSNGLQEGVGAYANYTDTIGDGRAIYGVNYDRLVVLKKKYDPGNLFNKWHPLVLSVSG
ncbi:MAG: hypothetical protein M1829_004460 [Trizodia sp. TS-e1964]|nr:MAG: hypothetical protein M1829_004460 [Trizodia sp. TS-e1964]